MAATKNDKKYYTWKGLEKSYDNYDDAKKVVNEIGLKNVFPPGFESEKEAEKFRMGQLDEYILNNYQPFEAALYDAIIYTDGSWDNSNAIASYGIIIFFKDETEPLIESGTLKDVGVGKYQIARYNRDGQKKEPEETLTYKDKFETNSFVSASQSAIGELYGAMRSLEICCKERGLKKILIVYDREGVKQGYDKKEKIDDAKGNAAAEYRIFLKKVKKDFLEDEDPQFEWVGSHGQYLIDEKEDRERIKKGKYNYKYPHAVYNDLVDILAKAETGKDINPKENFNVFRAISNEFERFSEAGADEPTKRRKHARALIKTVLKKANGKFRPIFPDKID